MVMIPYGPFAPDLSTYNGTTTALAQNVLPRADGYGPFKSFAAVAAPLASGNDSFTKILLHFDGTDTSTTITDDNAGGSAHTWTAAGNAQIDTAQFVFGFASGLFDGTGDWVTTNDHADFTLGSSNFTVKMRVRPAVDGSAMSFAGQGNSTTTAATSSIIFQRLASNKLQVRVSNGSAFTDLTGATTNIIAGAWYDVELVRSGDFLYLFVNGAVEVAATAFSGAINDSANAFRVGAGGENTVNIWNGWIDEFILRVGVADHISAFSPATQAADLPANGTARGLFYARKTDGSIVAFSGTINKLRRLDNTTLSWVDVTAAAGYSNLPTSYHWQFAQFGNFVVAVQPNVVPQVFDLSSSTVFATLGGSPPQAAYIATVGKFLVLSGLTSTPFRIQWSGLNLPAFWTAAQNSSDFQDFPDGGIVRGVAGGEFGVIFQDSVIRRMTYQVGAPYIFQIDRISEDKGLLAPYSIIKAGEKIFFLAQQGFHVIIAGGFPVAIGKEKFDRFFFNDYDKNALQLIIGASDPEGSRVFWGYKSQAGASGLFDKLLCYDYGMDRATTITGQAGEYMATLAAPGITLEGLDALFPNLDLMTISLDDFALSQLPKLALFNSAHQLGLFSGSNMEALLETPEQALDDRRVRVQGARPITDAPTCFISIGTRESQQAQVAYTTEQPVNVRGFCPANVSTKLARARKRIPVGIEWSFASGVEPLFKVEGRR